MAKLSEVGLILVRLAAAYNQTATEDQARGYHAVLGSFPRLVLVQAMAEMLGKSKFMPRPAELLAAAREINAGYREPVDGQFDEAGRWVMFRHGYQSTDELTEAQIGEVYAQMRSSAPAWMTLEVAA